MTTNITDDPFSKDSDQIVADGLAAVERMREHIKHIEAEKAAQPIHLAEARSAAEEARGWALIEEPFGDQIKTMTSTDGAASLALPNVLAKELWGARLAFDVLDAGDDCDEIDATIARLFSAANGDTGVTMTVMAAALSTIASLVVPQLLDEIEQHGSNWDERVRLSEARAKAWNGRVSELRATDDSLREMNVKGIDGYDIAASAMDDTYVEEERRQDGEPL